jgi:hypothetical protein
MVPEQTRGHTERLPKFKIIEKYLNCRLGHTMVHVLVLDSLNGGTKNKKEEVKVWCQSKCRAHGEKFPVLDSLNTRVEDKREG